MSLNPKQKSLLLSQFPELQGYFNQPGASPLAEMVIIKLIDKIETLKGEKGDDGITPVKGKDYYTDTELDNIITYLKKQVTPVKGVDYVDGKSIKGDQGEHGRDGKDSVIDPLIVADKLNTLKDAVDVSVIKGAVSKDELILHSNKLDSGMSKIDGRFKLADQRWHGGLGFVTTDTTLTGRGTVASPLSVAASEAGYVPYTGATTNVNLGANSLTATGITNSSMTLGSVLFAGTAGLLSQNNANFFWDNTNARLGIGTASPGVGTKLDILGGDYRGITLTSSDTTGTGMVFNNTSSGGRNYNLISTGANATPLAGTFSLYDTTMGQYRFVVNTSGNFGLGTTAPLARLDIANTVQLSERIRLSGQEFFAPANTDTNGISFILGVNRTVNRQLWIADSAKTGVSTVNPVIRILLGNAGTIDSIATDGSTVLPILFGNAGNTTQINGTGVGVGGAPGAGQQLTVTSSHTKQAYNQYGAFVQENYNPASAENTYGVFGGLFQNVKNGSSALGASYEQMTGIEGAVLNQGSGNITVAGGVAGIIQNTSTGVITHGRALEALSPTVSGANPITNAYGLYLNAQTATGVTNAYGVYQAGASDINYFQGSIGANTTTPQATLDINGSLRTITAAKSANYTLTTADSTIYATTGVGGITVTLPAASANTIGLFFFVYKVDSGVGLLTLAGAGADTINGLASKTIANQWNGVLLRGYTATSWLATSFTGL